MADIDYFKKYNDTYGHLAGDECIKVVSKAINRSTKRLYDITARYGGEEFAVVLASTNSLGARQVAQTIRKHVAQLSLAHKNSPVGDVVTLSLGVATMVPDLKSAPETLVGQADQALYQSKEDCRNRITIA